MTPEWLKDLKNWPTADVSQCRTVFVAPRSYHLFGGSDFGNHYYGRIDIMNSDVAEKEVGPADSEEEALRLLLS